MQAQGREVFVDHAVEVNSYCQAFLTWAQVAGRTAEEVAVLQRGCEVLQAKFEGKVSVKVLCAALGEFLLQTRAGEALVRDITKSCLLDRLVYGGEALRIEPCPIHRGKWSGCSRMPCPAGCNYGDNITGWLPASTP